MVRLLQGTVVIAAKTTKFFVVPEALSTCGWTTAEIAPKLQCRKFFSTPSGLKIFNSQLRVILKLYHTRKHFFRKICEIDNIFLNFEVANLQL